MGILNLLLITGGRGLVLKSRIYTFPKVFWSHLPTTTTPPKNMTFEQWYYDGIFSHISSHFSSISYIYSKINSIYIKIFSLVCSVFIIQWVYQVMNNTIKCQKLFKLITLIISGFSNIFLYFVCFYLTFDRISKYFIKKKIYFVD